MESWEYPTAAAYLQASASAAQTSTNSGEPWSARQWLPARWQMDERGLHGITGSQEADRACASDRPLWSRQLLAQISRLIWEVVVFGRRLSLIPLSAGTPSWIGEGGVCGDKGWVSGDVSWSRGRGIAFQNHLYVYCNSDDTWLLRETQTSTDSWFFLCIPGFWRNFKDVASLIRQRLNQG